MRTWLLRWAAGLAVLAVASSSSRAGTNAVARKTDRRVPIQVVMIPSSVAGPLEPSLEALLRTDLEVALLGQGTFRLDTNANLRVCLQVVNFIAPTPTRIARDNQGRLYPSTTSAGGVVSVLAIVKNRQGEELKQWVATQAFQPATIPSDLDGVIRRIAAQLAGFIRIQFGGRR